MPRTSVFEYVQNQPPCNSGEDLPLTPEEFEFFAEQERVVIIPNFSLDTVNSKLYCIEGTYGPFRPNVPVAVPLYLALSLHRRNKCRIQLPDWLAVENLRNLLQEERMVTNEFQPVPFYYIEISKLLFIEAKDVFGTEEELEETMTLVEELRKVRNSKIRDGLRNVSSAIIAIKLNNLGATECNTIRLLFKNSLNMWLQLGKDDKVWREERLQGGQASLPL